jgi:hypothetical protein
MLAGDQGRHHDPLGDRGPVDARRRRDGNVAVREDRMLGVVVHAGGEEMDEFEALRH